MVEKTEWMIVKVPYGGGYGPLNIASPKNTRRAPDALHREFIRQNIFLADNGTEVKNLEWYEPRINYWRQNCIPSWLRMNEHLLEESVSLLSEKKVLFLGGSHTITYTTFQALHKITKGPCGLVVFDAHPDCCNKSNWPIHSDWLRKLVYAHVSPENILLIGIRQMEKEEYVYLNDHGIEYYTIARLGNPKTCVDDNWHLSTHLQKLSKLQSCYVSIDIDVVSQAFAPGTGCPSPDGLTDSEIICLIKQLKIKLPNLKAMDLVEIDPLQWWRKLVFRRDQTVDLGVKIIKEIVS